MSCMISLTTWTLFSELIFSDYVGFENVVEMEEDNSAKR